MRLLLLLAYLPAAALAQPAVTTPKPTVPVPTPKPAASAAGKPAAPAAGRPTAPATVGKPATPASKPSTSAKPAPHKPVPAASRKPATPPAPATPVPEAAPAPAVAPEAGKGSNTGLPLPRFAALRSDDVNFRSGPGTRYPIEWVYKRRDLPVQIEREFETWRLVRDPEGNKGWVLGATLTGRRTAVVATAEHTLRQAASDTAGPVAKLKPGVIMRLRSCEASSEWCQAQVGDYRGFIRRSEIWGVMPGEVIQ